VGGRGLLNAKQMVGVDFYYFEQFAIF